MSEIEEEKKKIEFMDNDNKEEKKENENLKNKINEEKKEEKIIIKQQKEDKSNQTFENQEKQIKYLEQKIEEQNKIINELKEEIKNLEIKYNENEIILSSKLEVETIFSNVKNDFFHEFQNRILSMKSNIRTLKKEIEKQLKNKDIKFKEKTQLIINQIENLSNKEKKYVNKIEIFSSQSENYQKQLKKYINERTTMEDIIIKQEEKLNILIEKIKQVEEIIKRKNRILKENEAYSIELIKIIEQQKNQINEYKNNFINNNNRIIDKSKFNNKIFSNFQIFKSRNKIEKDDKNHLRFFSLDEINNQNNNNNDINVLPKIVNSLSSKNIMINNIEDENNNNERKIKEFKSMMNQLIDDINN